MPAAVLVPIVLHEKPAILLTKRNSHLKKHAGQVSFPGGRIDPDDRTPEAAALREAWEEIGLAPGRLERLRGLFPAPGFCDEELIYFRVSDLREPAPDSPHAPDEDEDIHPQVFTIAAAKAMLARGEIIDLKTAYGLTLL